MKATEVVATLLQQRPTDASRRWHPDIETQILADHPGYAIRIDETNPGPCLSFKASLITRIGSTGRNFKTRRAEWIGIDIDANDHVKGYDASTIDRIVDAVGKVPYVDMFWSTGGKGLHLHVPLSVPVASRKEHSELGLYVVNQISLDAGLDLSRFVDVAGGNLWVWA